MRGWANNKYRSLHSSEIDKLLYIGSPDIIASSVAGQKSIVYLYNLYYMRRF